MEHTNLYIKVMASTAFLLPVLFVLMLPGLIFNGYQESFSEADPDSPILNSDTAIVEAANEITFTIHSILQQGLEDVQKRIEADFAASDGDGMETINPYGSGLIYNGNLFVAQYCAYKCESISGISIPDMADVLWKNKHHLYSYNRTVEFQEKTEKDPETGEDITIIEKWFLYTIVYNGEAYFAGQVFALNEKQEALADDYAENLSLFLGDGMLQSLAEWTGEAVPSLGNVHFTDGATNVVYYNQMDERYANKPYGTDHIGGYGCGPASMAIVVSSLTDGMVDPEEMAAWAYQNGYWCKGSGSYHALIPAAAQHWGLPVSGCTASEPQRILDALSQGKLVVAIMAEGHFTKSGHFIVLRGVKDGQILVADPGSYSRSQKSWELSLILNEASRRAAAGGPFWIIG